MMLLVVVCLFLDETFKGVISVLATEWSCFGRLKTVHMYGFPVLAHSGQCCNVYSEFDPLMFSLNTHWAISLFFLCHEYCCSQFKSLFTTVLLGHGLLARSSDWPMFWPSLPLSLPPSWLLSLVPCSLHRVHREPACLPPDCCSPLFLLTPCS